jgi:hypothetical protein
MSEELLQVEMSYVLGWHAYSRSNDLPEAFGQFSKELEVVARSRGGNAAVDFFTGRGISTNDHIIKTILQSVVFSMTDIYDLCLEQAEKIERICVVSDHDIVSHVKGLEKGERVALHFGPVPAVFESLCECLVCRVLLRVVEAWMAVYYLKAAQKLIDGDQDADVSEEKKRKILRYIATELQEDPLVLDDDMVNWISTGAADTIADLKSKFTQFKGFKAHRISDFLFMIKWKNFFANLYSEVLVICEIVYTSYGSRSRWDSAPLVLPIVMMSSGAVSLQRTIMNVFNGILPDNCPRIRAHKRLLLKLFPS